MSQFPTAPFEAMISEKPRNGLYKSKEYIGSGNRWLKMKDVYGKPFIRDQPTERLEVTTEEEQKYGCEAGDLLFGRTSVVAEGVGTCAIVEDVSDVPIFESNLFRIRLDQAKAVPRFYFYFFRSPLGRHLILSIARQTAATQITSKDLITLSVPSPPLPEQRAIASILGTLDDKIELNRRMNATLESMARAIFKSWFVDFDPVKINAGLMSAEGYDPKILDLFPSAFEESELGLIPEGWATSTIEKVVESVGGATPSTKKPEYWENGTLPWATPKDLSGLQAPVLTQTDRRITELGADKISSGMLPIGTVLMSSRAPVGYLAIATIPVAINQGFIAIKPNERVSNYFMLNWCDENMDRIKGRASGTTFQEISKKSFRPMKICVPPLTLVQTFTDAVRPLYDSMVEHMNESRTLSQQRDVLLPQLLSGNLPVTLEATNV